MCQKIRPLNMVPKMFIYAMTMLALLGAVTAVPESVLCCGPGMGTFKTKNEEPFCWNEKTNNSYGISLKCNYTVTLNSDEDVQYSVSDNGQVYMRLPELVTEMESGSVCVANHTSTSGGSTYNVELLVVCVEEKLYDDSVLHYCEIVSVIFLAFTALIYAALPEVRDLQGKSIVNFCTSLALGLALLAVLNLVEFSDMNLCAVRGFLVYFFFIASFFWTNAISIQILLSMRRPVVNNYSWKVFFWYALYAWGCSAILTMIVAIVNFYPGDHLKPGIGLNTCWFINRKQQWYYMYSVMTILILVNIAIFAYTSFQLWRISFSSSHVKALKYKFTMTLRMFVIMGLPWIFEMISSLSAQSIVWFILDLFNMLQGPLIFLLLVVFRKRVIKALLKRGLLDCIAGPVEKYLALKEDDEEGVIQQTVDVTMDDRNGNGLM